MKVYVDSREKQYVHKAFKKELKRCTYKEESLVIGDILVGDFLIERKSINDLYSSIIKGNLFEQLTQLNKFKEQNPHVIILLVIEYGKLSQENRQYFNLWNLNKISMNVIQEFNVMTVFTKNIYDTVKFINDVVLYTNENRKIINNIRGFKRKKSLKYQKKFALMGFPTIGDKTSDKIIDEHKTLMKYFATQKGKQNKIAEVLYK